MADDGATGGGRKKKEKKKKLVISLWINKTKYVHGCLCTFCSKVPAIKHCAECPDFFCEDCDKTAHATKKRAGHERQMLSKLDLKQAAGLVTRYTRLVQHLKNNMARARKVYRRYFDSKTLCHYYYNSKYGYVTWTKPFCLRKEELYAFYTEYSGATKIQCIYYLYKSRIKTNERIREYYRKIFDRTRGRFYYTWLGKSELLPKSSWYAPTLFGKRGYPRDIKPIFTKDAAAVIIQRQWRSVLVYKLFHALVRGSYDQIWDPVNGNFTYYHRETEILYQQKPMLLGNAPWDPNYIPTWEKADVKMFLRRIGFKKYAENLFNYNVDGRALLLMDDEDFDNVDIFNKIHRKKIRVEVKKRYPHEFKERMSEEASLRREAIRKFKLFTLTAQLIQAVFRGYLARKDVWLKKEMIRLGIFEAEVEKEVAQSAIWWTYRDDIPTKKLKPYNVMNSHTVKEIEAPESESGVLEKLRGDSNLKLKLPAIQMKLFGRKRDHKNVLGWGRLTNATGDFEKLDLTSYHDHRGKGEENFTGIDNASRAFSKRLHVKGYDKRREARAKGEVVAYVETDENGDAIKEEKVEEEEEEEEGEDDTFGNEDEARELKDKKKAAAASGILDEGLNKNKKK